VADVSFNVGVIGPEPAGATPIADEDLEGLIPGFVATRADLNQVEYENILRHLPKAQQRARRQGPQEVLTVGFVYGLHRGMFSDVWRWAGTQRRRGTNIGVDPSVIGVRCAEALSDARFWAAESVFEPDELATRVHARLVDIHPFPNGNGRCTRLVADLYLTSINHPAFSWGSDTLDRDGATRSRYLAALVHAINTDHFGPLVDFARS
jgi:Fic-DOC domain mobile mystery protein B